MSKVKDITGQRFGRLTVVGRSGSSIDGKAMWLCQCDCGNTVRVIGKSLRAGLTRSCGCYKHEVAKTTLRTHGQRYTRLYYTWLGMKDRCNNPNNKSYCRYGGVGVKVCEEWEQFEPFYEWAMSNGYRDDLTIDRIDCSKGYSPDNCRWADAKTQSRNRRNVLIFTYRGFTENLSALCERFGKDYRLVIYRIEHGWSIHEAMTLPRGTRVKDYRALFDGAVGGA